MHSRVATIIKNIYLLFGVPLAGRAMRGFAALRTAYLQHSRSHYYPSRILLTVGTSSPPHTRKSNVLGFLGFAFLLLPFGILAQPQNDFRAQAYLSVSKQINPSWNVHCLLTTGLYQNVSEVQYVFGELGADFKINTNWSVGANYRRSKVRNLDNFFDDRQIASIETNFSKTKNNLNFAWRTRLQTQWYGASFTENFRPNRYYLRNKFLLRYPLNYYWRPYMSLEPFVRLDGGWKFDNLRYAGGMQYRINEIWKLDAFVQINQQLNRSVNATNLALGLGLSCAL